MIEPVVLIYRCERVVLERSPQLALTIGSERLSISEPRTEAIAWHDAYARSMNRTLRGAYEHVRPDARFHVQPEELERILTNAHAALSISDALANQRSLRRLAERYALTSAIHMMHAYALIDPDRPTN